MPKLYSLNEGNYSIEIIKEVICLRDLGLRNGIEYNAQFILKQLHNDGHDPINNPIIFKNTSGTWNIIKIDYVGDVFRFDSLEVEDLLKAISILKTT